MELPETFRTKAEVQVMEKYNHLDELPIAALNEEQLKQLKQTELELNTGGNEVYLIAFQKSKE